MDEQVMPSGEARSKWSRVVDDALEEDIVTIVTRRGVEKVAIVPVKKYRRLLRELARVQQERQAES